MAMMINPMITSMICYASLSAFAENFFFILLDRRNIFLSDRYAIFQVEIVEYSTERHTLGFFQKSEALEVLSCIFIAAQCGQWLQQSLEDALLCGTCTNDISTEIKKQLPEPFSDSGSFFHKLR